MTLLEMPLLEHESEKELFEELRQIYEDKLREIEQGGDEKAVSSYSERVEYAQSLAKKYGRDEMNSYKLFHLLIGSTVDEERSPHLDLPTGEMEHYIREEL